MLCIPPGYGYKFCEYFQWGEHPSSNVNCSEKGTVIKSIAFTLSFIPFLGLSNFYIGHYFSGVFELVQGIFTVASICMCFSCICTCKERIKTVIKTTLLILLLLCNVLEFIHMLCSETFEVYVIILTISLFVIVLCRCCCGMFFTNISTLVTVLTVVLNTLGDALMVWLDGVQDRYGCSFVD